MVGRLIINIISYKIYLNQFKNLEEDIKDVEDKITLTKDNDNNKSNIII
jgi:hypothetical protein